MLRTFVSFVSLAFLCIGAVTWAKAEQPAIGKAKRIAPGVLVYEAGLKGKSPEGVVWIYVPEKKPEGKVPCILIAPAGSSLVTGMKLSEGDSKEHIPYVKAGNIVVAYALDGDFDEEKKSDAVFLAAAKAFKESDAGVANAKAALDYALAKVPAIDPKRIYTAGHSSAGTVALVVAAKEPRIAGCMAYAPATDLGKRIPAPLVVGLDKQIPGFRQFLVSNSPIQNAPKITCPVLLFYALDDSNIPIAQTENFLRLMGKTNKKVTYIRTKTGDHYDSMIARGIPHGINWIKKQGAPGDPAKAEQDANKGQKPK